MNVEGLNPSINNEQLAQSANAALVNDQLGNETDLKLRNYAINALSCGECLRWAKYAKYVPGSPKILKNPSLPWIGDTCRLIKTGLLIEGKVRHILSEKSSFDEKFEDALDIADLALKLSDTQFAECLPEKLKETIQQTSKVCNIARLGYGMKKKADSFSEQTTSIGKARDALDVTRSAAWTATAFLDLVGPEQFFCLKTTLKVGSLALAPAVGGLSAAKIAEDLLSSGKKEAAAAA